MPVSMILKSAQSVTIEKKVQPVVSLLKKVQPSVRLVLGGGVAEIFSTTQWQNITSPTWEAVTQTWD